MDTVVLRPFQDPLAVSNHSSALRGGRIQDILAEGGGLLARLLRSSGSHSRTGSRPTSAVSAAFPSRPASAAARRPPTASSSASSAAGSTWSAAGRPAVAESGEALGDGRAEHAGSERAPSVRALGARSFSRPVRVPAGI